MKRIRINTTFEEDEEERRQFFSGLSYSERFRYYFKLRNMVNFNKKKNTLKGKYLSFIVQKMGFDIDDPFYRSFLFSMQNRGVRYILIGGMLLIFTGSTGIPGTWISGLPN